MAPVNPNRVFSLGAEETVRGEFTSVIRCNRSAGILYLLYHELSVCPCEYSYALEAKTFERHLDLFARPGSADDGGLRPEITFDDGHISNFEQAVPMLEARGLTAQFFITAGWTGRKPGYMRWRELQSICKLGHSIGAHGWSHRFLTHCTQEELDIELVRARGVLEDKLGIPITTMSVPGGRFDRRILAACRAAGYTKVFTSVPKAEQMPGGFIVGRLNIRSEMSLEMVWSVLQPGCRLLATLGRQYRMKAAVKAILGDRLYDQLWTIVNRKESEIDTRDMDA